MYIIHVINTLFLCRSLSHHTHSYLCTQSHMHTHIHIHTLSLSQSHTHTLTLTLTPMLTHSHTHTHAHTLSHSHSHKYSHTNTQTHTPLQAALDLQVRDLNTRLQEGLANTTKNAKREAAKLQARVSDTHTEWFHTVLCMHNSLQFWRLTLYFYPRFLSPSSCFSRSRSWREIWRQRQRPRPMHTGTSRSEENMWGFA